MSTTTLEFKDSKTEAPTAEDIARALAGPRDDDWVVSLYRGDDDYMEVMLDRGDLWVECEEGGRFLQAKSYVDEAAANAMLLAFSEGSAGWRDLAAWAEPAREVKKGPPPMALSISAGIGVVVLTLVLTAMLTGNGGWIVVLVALALPGVIAIAAFVKQGEIKRASTWTKGSARIVRSELATEQRHGKEVKVPRVEYEYNAGFHRYRGKRVSLAEFVGGGDATAMVNRHRVGAGVPVYYDPADPTRSVLERDLPPFFSALWIFVGVLTAIILAGAWWFLVR